MYKNVLEFLENSVKRLPDKVCFEDEDKSYTFSQLYDRARRIGSALKGVGHNRPVAVMMKKGVDCIAAMLGVVYSGNFYGPVDISMPPKRIDTILSLLNPVASINDENFAEYCEAEIDDEFLENVRAAQIAEDPLYVVYTSGSTGIPKGVLTPHRAVINFVQSFVKNFGMDENDIHGNQAPLDYDASVKDVYSTLLTGGSTYIIPQRFFTMPKLLFDCVIEHHVKTLVWTVSALTIPVNLNAFAYRVPDCVERVLFSGAVMPCRILRVWQENLPNTMFVNLYGLTETTCNCTFYKVSGPVKDTDVLPIGKPFDNLGIVLLNKDANGIGEICVRGAGLALGYYNDRKRTDELFIRNPEVTEYEDRIYKTGDLGSIDGDGILWFHGRSDSQIKHMGHRVELPEIEAAVCSMQNVGEAVVLYNTEKEKITLFYVGDADKKEIAKYLGILLPKYMIPTGWFKLDAMPRLANSKIDRKALRAYFEENRE